MTNGCHRLRVFFPWLAIEIPDDDVDQPCHTCLSPTGCRVSCFRFVSGSEALTQKKQAWRSFPLCPEWKCPYDRCIPKRIMLFNAREPFNEVHEPAQISFSEVRKKRNGLRGIRLPHINLPVSKGDFL